MSIETIQAKGKCYEFISSKLNIHQINATLLSVCIVSARPTELHAILKLQKDVDSFEFSKIIAKDEFDNRRLTIVDKLDSINIGIIDEILNGLLGLQEEEINASLVDS